MMNSSLLSSKPEPWAMLSAAGPIFLSQTSSKLSGKQFKMIERCHNLAILKKLSLCACPNLCNLGLASAQDNQENCTFCTAHKQTRSSLAYFLPKQIAHKEVSKTLLKSWNECGASHVMMTSRIISFLRSFAKREYLMCFEIGDSATGTGNGNRKRLTGSLQWMCVNRLNLNLDLCLVVCGLQTCVERKTRQFFNFPKSVRDAFVWD